MDFSFTEVQEDVRGLARKILDEEVTRERLKELEAGTDRVDRALWAKFAEANLIGLALPEAVGGSGLGIIEMCVVLDEIGRHVAPLPLLSTVLGAAIPIAEYGTAAQQQQYLPAVIAGTSLLSPALHEPANDDPRRPRTTARRDASGWVLDGEKIAVPWGPLVDGVLVPAATGPDSVGVFMVDPAGPGVTIEGAEATHREPQATLGLAGAHIAADAVLGDPMAGTVIVDGICRLMLAGTCATAVGVFDEAIRITARYISEREQFGRPLATFQGASLKAADAYIDAQATSIATWSAIWRLAEGRPAEDQLAIAKFWVADGGQRIVHACQHLHGGMGVDIDYPIHRYFLWAKELELTLGGATQQLVRLGDALAAASEKGR